MIYPKESARFLRMQRNHNKKQDLPKICLPQLAKYIKIEFSKLYTDIEDLQGQEVFERQNKNIHGFHSLNSQVLFLEIPAGSRFTPFMEGLE